MTPRQAAFVISAMAAYLAPAPASPGAPPPVAGTTEMATLGGGCFWCIEAVYRELKGISKVESGYSGGQEPNPTYEQVSSHRTGHAEVVQITFDPRAVSYKELLQVFFTVHDPTTPDRQGADVGPQYRSIIFYHTRQQKRTAEAVIAELTDQKVFKNPIVTRIEPYKAFYKAEEHHQNYYGRNPDQPYCTVVIAPKIAKLRKMWTAKLKKP